MQQLSPQQRLEIFCEIGELMQSTENWFQKIEESLSKVYNAGISIPRDFMVHLKSIQKFLADEEWNYINVSIILICSYRGKRTKSNLNLNRSKIKIKTTVLVVFFVCFCYQSIF